MADGQPKYVNKAGLAHFWEAVKSEAKNAAQTEKRTNVDTSLVGRIAFTDATCTNPQGMCLVSDTVGVFAISNSTTTNKCVLYKVDLASGEVLGEFSTTFAHCNGMCYNSTTGKLYVCPNYDYTTSGRPSLDQMYVVNVDTMAVESTLSFDFSPHSVCYDRITGKMYMTGESFSPYTIKLYAFEPSTGSAELMGEIDLPSPDVFAVGGASFGTHEVASYDGILYYAVGAENSSAVLCINEDGSTDSVINVSGSAYIYRLFELEGIDFNSNGDMVLFSLGTTSLGVSYGVITCMNFSGKTIYNNYVDNIGAAVNMAHVDGSKGANYNILQTGQLARPFATFEEAWCAVQNSYNTMYVYMDADCALRATTFGGSNQVNVVGNSHILSVSSQTSFYQPVRFERVSFEFTQSIQTPLRFYRLTELDNCTFDCTNATTAAFMAADVLWARKVTINNMGNYFNVTGNTQGALFFDDDSNIVPVYTVFDNAARNRFVGIGANSSANVKNIQNGMALFAYKIWGGDTTTDAGLAFLQIDGSQLGVATLIAGSHMPTFSYDGTTHTLTVTTTNTSGYVRCMISPCVNPV